MFPNIGETIIAKSTASGEAAIAIVRLSGEKAISAVSKYFTGKNLKKAKSHCLYVGNLVNEEKEMIDEVVIGIFKGPNSYTKEDVVEISCHGSEYVVQLILQLFLRNDIRMAEPGEFTLRAFMNGRMDLSQAEAVADLIASQSAKSHEIAVRQMRGGISREIQHLRQELIDFASLLELELDFSEEDVEFANRQRFIELIRRIQTVIHPLIQSFQFGNAIKAGVPTVIAGRPNAGKSTLLNTLLQEERAIVSEIPGTTRDTVEESLVIQGIQFRLIDTAGIRDARDQIEAIGVGKTLEKIEQSAIVLYVFDATTMNEQELRKDLLALPLKHAHVLLIANKIDKNPGVRWEDFHMDELLVKESLILCSAKNQLNISSVKDKLYEKMSSGLVGESSAIVSNARHYQALREADQNLNHVLEGMEAGLSTDLLAIDVRQALFNLGEITGEVTTDDLLESIFTRFCIGK